MGFLKNAFKVAKAVSTGDYVELYDELKDSAQTYVKDKVTSNLKQTAQSFIKDKVVNNLQQTIDEKHVISQKEILPKMETRDSSEKQFVYKNKTVFFKEGIEEIFETRLPKDTESVIFSSTLCSLDGVEFKYSPYIKKLDFTRCKNIDNCDAFFEDEFPSLQVVVLPPRIVSMPHFSSGCPNLVEIHVPRSIDYIEEITGDKDHRLTLYLSSSVEYSYGVCMDCKQIFMPKSATKEWRKGIIDDDIDDEVIIKPLPDGYSFPKVAFSTPVSEGFVIPNDEEVVDEVLFKQTVKRSQYNEDEPEIQPVKKLESTCPPPPPSFKYFAIVEGVQHGPYNEEQFSRLVKAGLVTSTTLVWCERMNGWEKAENVDDLFKFFPKSFLNTSHSGENSSQCPPPLPIE